MNVSRCIEIECIEIYRKPTPKITINPHFCRFDIWILSSSAPGKTTLKKSENTLTAPEKYESETVRAFGRQVEPGCAATHAGSYCIHIMGTGLHDSRTRTENAMVCAKTNAMAHQMVNLNPRDTVPSTRRRWNIRTDSFVSAVEYK
jgi:hypothetical protein